MLINRFTVYPYRTPSKVKRIHSLPVYRCSRSRAKENAGQDAIIILQNYIVFNKNLIITIEFNVFLAIISEIIDKSTLDHVSVMPRGQDPVLQLGHKHTIHVR